VLLLKNGSPETDESNSGLAGSDVKGRDDTRDHVLDAFQVGLARTAGCIDHEDYVGNEIAGKF